MAEQAGGTQAVAGPAEQRGVGGLIAALVLLALVRLLTASQDHPPEPKPREAPAAEFSAGRAGEILRALVGDNRPHPVGSAANAEVRERILAQLRREGYTPEVQEGSACEPGVCARVWNVVARLPGREPGKSVLLMSHYDSVPAGPGASDDMTGVAAVLEAARALKAGSPPRHSVLFLLEDGEEAGLLGASAFAEGSPDMAQVGAVVNLEARGTAGPSLMFETSGDDRWMIEAYASRAQRPFTTSLFSTIYQLMPNDTDLTVFKRRGIPGLNFAIIGNPSYYHTPLDNLEHASPASLQHHGDNAMAAVRGLAEADLAHPPRGRAVWFDLFHGSIVRWSAGASALLGLLAAALCLTAAWLARRRGLATWGDVALGVVTPLAAVFLSAAVGFGLQALLASAFPTPWIARPLPAMIAFWLLPLAICLALAGSFSRRAGSAGLWAGVWTGWALLGLLTGVTLPGLSYLFLPAALVAGLCGVAVFAAGGSRAGRIVAALVPAVVAALIWFPALGSLYLGLGLFGLLVTAVLLAFIFSTLTPLVGPAGTLGRKWLPIAAAAGVALGAVTAMATPPNSPEAPRNIVVQLHQDADTGQARWLLRTPPPFPAAMRQAAAFAQRPERPFPWSPPQAVAFVAPAPRLDAPGPELTVVADSTSGGKRHLRLRLVSRRGAPVGILAIPAEARVESVKIDGRTSPTRTARRNSPGPGGPPGWEMFTNLTLPPAGSELEIVLGATQPLEWYAMDRSFGLPPSSQALLAARPKDAVPIQDGDVVLVSRKVKI
jgi:hypothetical protein